MSLKTLIVTVLVLGLTGCFQTTGSYTKGEGVVAGSVVGMGLMMLGCPICGAAGAAYGYATGTDEPDKD